MRPSNCTANEFFFTKECLFYKKCNKKNQNCLGCRTHTNRFKKIVNELTHQKDKLVDSFVKLLEKYKEMFNGTLRKFSRTNYIIELKEGA